MLRRIRDLMEDRVVNELATGNGDTALVRSVVELGEALEMFYFAHPLEGAEVAELFAARSPSPA